VLAKALAALDVLSSGRVVAGLAPGSSESDYASVGVPFAQRGSGSTRRSGPPRLLRGDSFVGTHYTVDEPLTPLPVQPGGPPLWLGSWGSDAGMRRVADVNVR
jgi:alkanesulfonate monooxygenase SsuD/methylene tetrahydromethanopterin reductase-like flavin-dependent oxidoreductase (luciferase family)